MIPYSSKAFVNHPEVIYLGFGMASIYETIDSKNLLFLGAFILSYIFWVIYKRVEHAIRWLIFSTPLLLLYFYLVIRFDLTIKF